MDSSSIIIIVVLLVVLITFKIAKKVAKFALLILTMVGLAAYIWFMYLNK